MSNRNLPDWLGPHIESPINGDPIWKLESVRLRSTDIRELPNMGWMAMRRTGPDNSWLDFAVLDRHMCDAGGGNPHIGLVFHGSGPDQGLRECRHTYWGDNGYLYEPDGKLIAAAFEVLAEFFDEMM